MKHEDLLFSMLPHISADLRKGYYRYPLLIEIHPTEICNYRCEYCLSQQKIDINNNTHGKKPISVDRYGSLFKEMCSLGINYLSISGGGEPFIDQRILELLRLACTTDLQVRVVTNGSVLSDEAISELMRCEEIRISLNTINSATYSEITRAPELLLSTTLHNIEHLINLSRKNGSSLSIGVSLLVLPKNHFEVATFCKHMLGMGIDAVVIKYDMYHLLIPDRKAIDRINSDLLNIGDSRLEVREPLIMNMAEVKCFSPFFKIAINPYGDVFSCCLGAQLGEINGYFLANLQFNSFETVWKSSENSVRNLASGVTCATCNYTDYLINQMIMESMCNKE